MSTPAAADELAARQPEQPDNLWAAASRALLVHVDDALAARFDRGDDVDRLLAARAEAVDALVREAWARCIAADAAMALFAVGGYGRGELFPQSDIDLLVLAGAAYDSNRDRLVVFGGFGNDNLFGVNGESAVAVDGGQTWHERIVHTEVVDVATRAAEDRQA